MNRKFRIFTSFLYILIVVLFGFNPIYASDLRDIRIGEYKRFTRIVFELDSTSAAPDIKIQPSGQLSVTFKSTRLNLVRKIPVERSPHVKEIQFWQRKSTISALLYFDYPHIRIETFRLSGPTRFAVDVFPTAVPMTKKTKIHTTPMKDEQSDEKKTIAEEVSPLREANANKNRSPIAEKTAPPIVDPDQENSPRKHATTEKSQRSKLQIDAESRTEKSGQNQHSSAESISSKEKTIIVESISSPQTTEPKSESNSVQNTPQSRQKMHMRNNPLQFYLSAILVILIIAILFLLILMLLTRRRSISDRTLIKSTKRTRYQDKIIE